MALIAGAGLTVIFVSTISASRFAVAAEPPKKVELKTELDRVSYGIGRNIGEQIKGEDIELNLEMIIQGMRAAFAGTPSAQTEEEFKQAFESLQKTTQEKSLQANEDFLAKNGKQKGIKSTKSGLQYQIIEAGDGKKPTAKDQVKAHYKGTFLNGKTFDSSYDRDEPAIFPLNRVIKGWTEGVQLMAVGSKFKFWIPSDLAYGPQGRPGIPANSLLVFEIELLEIIPADEEEK